MVVKDLCIHSHQGIYGGEYRLLGSKEYQILKIEDFTKKLWITGHLQIASEDKNIAPTFIENKIAVCDVPFFCLYNQKVTMEQFKFLCSVKLEAISLWSSVITNSNGHICPLENILYNVPKIRYVKYCYNDETVSTVTPESTKNIVQFIKNSNLESVNLNQLPETCDVDAFFKLIYARFNNFRIFYCISVSGKT
uniref:Uncharacterized protein n=1 Tax=Panagrolaimus sp. ES5 TaxID=591445 RepID=A0AC34F1S2_9BILA